VPSCRSWRCSTASGLGPFRIAPGPDSAATAAQVNALLARAHHIIYSSRRSTWRNFFLFLRDGYPRVFRQQIAYVFAALVLLLAGGVIAAAFTWPTLDSPR